MSAEALRQLDAVLFLSVNRISAPGWEWAMGWGTWLGHGLVLTLLAALALRRLDSARFPKNLLVIGLGVALAGGVNSGLKSLFERPRPLKDPLFELGPVEHVRDLPGGLPVWEARIGNPDLAARAPVVKVLGPKLRRRAFPSGHAAAVFATAAGLVYAFPRRRLAWTFAAAAGVAFSRIACGVHFPSDVVVGALVGSLVCPAFLWATESLHGLRAEPRPPPPRSDADAATRLLFVAGEASGDLYGARVLRTLRQREPDLEAFGIGGDGLAAAGLERVGDASDLEIVGFTGVLTRLPAILRLYRRALGLLRARRPHALVCIDLPDFNFMLALQARALGIPSVFVIGPQFWAWRSGRIARMAPRISKLVVALPFEAAHWERAGVDVSFHGHPLLETLAPRFADRAAARAHFGLDAERRIVVLAPGSRRSEWRHHLRALFGAAARIAAAHPEVQFALPLAPRADAEAMQAAARRAGVEVVCTRGDNFDLFRCADLGIVCSGTATLEAALAELPMVIFYRGNWLNALLAKLLVEVDRYGLPNILLGGEEPTFPERIQHRASADGLADAALGLLSDEAALARLRAAGGRVRALLEGGATSAAIAADVLVQARSSAARTLASG